MLFESYFNKVLQVSDEIQKMIEDAFSSADYKSTHDGVQINIHHKDFPMTVKFNLLPSKSDSRQFADMRNFVTARRQTVQLKSGKKRRRILPVKGGVLTICVANLIMEYRNQIPFFSQLQPYIKSSKKDSFFIQGLSDKQFANVCKALIHTAPFQAIFTHEVQHNYNPLSHQKVLTPSRSKGKMSKAAKYVTREDEINSAIAEAITYVRHHNADDAIFAEPSPKSFVDECIAFLVRINRWDYYDENARKRIARRLSQTFYSMRQPSQA